MLEELNGPIRQLFQAASRIEIVSHIRPDGDAIGSLLGLGLSLEAAGKEVQMVLQDGIPVSFRHLPGSQKVVRRPTGPFDLVVVVDCSDLKRTGGVVTHQPDLNIDHHITNLNFARLNYVMPVTEATCSILTEALPEWGLPLNEQVAQALLTGVISDTLGFRTSNVTPNTLRLAAGLMEKGANLAELYNRALIRRTYEAARMWGLGLERLQRDGRLVWTSLTLEDRHRSSYPGNDDADLVNILSSIDESDIGVIFVEQKNDHVKVSWRAQPGWDISGLALQFGGGGHPAAAGADILGALPEIREKVLSATRQVLANGPAGKLNQ
jgi:phosphoesterase RecJ-like protein